MRDDEEDNRICYPIPDIIKIIIGIIIFALIGVAIYVLVERIKEIRRREYDDLSKY